MCGWLDSPFRRAMLQQSMVDAYRVGLFGFTYTVPSQTSAQWAGFVTAMGKAGMTLAQMSALKPGMVVRPDGTILQQSTGYAIPGTTIASSLGSNSTLIIALVAVAGLMMFMGKR